MIWKCAPTPFYSSPHYLAGVGGWGGCQESLPIRPQGERGGALEAGCQYSRCPPCGSAVLLTAAVSALTSLQRGGHEGRGEMQGFPTSRSGNPGSPAGGREAGLSALTSRDC